MKKRLVCCMLFIMLFVFGCNIIDKPNVQLGGEPKYIEITVEDSVFEEKFYYEHFSDKDKIVYKEIYQGILEVQEEITVHCADGEVVNKIFSAILMDFPQIFWADGSGNSTSYNETYTVFKPTYTYVGHEKDKRENEIENVVSEIIASVGEEWSDYEKIKYIYEYLVNTVTYVENAADNQNVYSAIVGKQSVCAGYAKANQYLLERLGIPCIYVTGTANGQNGMDLHAWNIVKCNGAYYYVDVTWADSVWVDEHNNETEEVLYDYLCCDEQALAGTHVADEGYDFPECNASDLNYYALNHMYYQTANRTDLLEVMYDAIDKRDASTVFKFADEQTYHKAKKLIVDELLATASQYLGESYGLEEVKCLYEMQDELSRFVVYWKYE